MTQLEIFDTYKIIKRLENKGASTELAEEIVQAIQEGRTLELSALVSKSDFYEFKEVNDKRLGNIEIEIALIKKELGAIDSKIELSASHLETKLIKWMIGLLSPLYIGVFILIIKLLIL